ncbi:uncharacterized protein EHS24_007544 [Apiotrichum porosum]|uniref:Uncharacterized protein n=1 Tax=Apiotrichum porosum TaxID=105984 RepID=A0A427XUQ1_9TREE|nr:uncharacterized protein EHS24_007544 [Apiotrichum porosum]RSH82562.1 hypothetical protein EHS24_007544 [Apiotrichum porosum]
MSNHRLPPVAEHTEAVTDDDDSDWEDEAESTEAARTESEVSDDMDEDEDSDTDTDTDTDADAADHAHPPPAYEHHDEGASPEHNPETCLKRFLHLKDEGFVAREGFFAWRGKTVFGKLRDGVIEVYRQPLAELVTTGHKDIDTIGINLFAFDRSNDQDVQSGLAWKAMSSIKNTGNTDRLAIIDGPADGPEWNKNDPRCVSAKSQGLIHASGLVIPMPCLAFAEVYDGKTVIVSACLYCQVSGKMCDFVVGKYQVPTKEKVALVNRAELVARIKESADRTAAFANQSVIDCCHRRAMDEVAMHLKWVAQQLEAAHAHSEAQS